MTTLKKQNEHRTTQYGHGAALLENGEALRRAWHGSGMVGLRTKSDQGNDGLSAWPVLHASKRCYAGSASAEIIRRSAEEWGLK